MAVKKLIRVSEESLWVRVKACAARRDVGVWAWVEEVLEGAVRREEREALVKRAAQARRLGREPVFAVPPLAREEIREREETGQEVDEETNQGERLERGGPRLEHFDLGREQVDDAPDDGEGDQEEDEVHIGSVVQEAGREDGK